MFGKKFSFREIIKRQEVVYINVCNFFFFFSDKTLLNWLSTMYVIIIKIWHRYRAMKKRQWTKTNFDEQYDIII